MSEHWMMDLWGDGLGNAANITIVNSANSSYGGM